MKGVVLLGRHPDGNLDTYQEEDFEFEQTWWEGTRLVFKCYDRFETCVFIKIEASVLMTELLGFAADVEIKGPVQEEPPRDQEPG